MIEVAAKIITGFTNGKHIDQIAESIIWDSIFGSENRVLKSGSSLGIDVMPEKGVIKILDGVFIFSKRFGVVEKFDTVTFTPMVSDNTYMKIVVAIRYFRTAQSEGGEESFNMIKKVSTIYTSEDEARNHLIQFDTNENNQTTISTDSTGAYKAFFPLYEIIVNRSKVVSSKQLFETMDGVTEISRLGKEGAISEQTIKDKKRVSDITKERQTADTNLEASITSHDIVKTEEARDLVFISYKSGERQQNNTYLSNMVYSFIAMREKICAIVPSAIYFPTFYATFFPKEGHMPARLDISANYNDVPFLDIGNVGISGVKKTNGGGIRGYTISAYGVNVVT